MAEFKHEDFYFVGNNLAIDFANSIMFDLTNERFREWVVKAGVAGANDSARIDRTWKGKSMAPVIAFRSILRAAFEELAAGKRIRRSQLDKINKVLRRMSGSARLVELSNGYSMESSLDLDAPQDALVPIVKSFTDLVCYGNLEYLRKCESPECLLFFYDSTRNHQRRWCSMSVCGNRAKATKFYYKRKTAG